MWYRRAPRAKYGNVPKRYNGQTYHSTLEASYAAYLDILLKAKEIQSYRTQVTFRLDINGKHICKIVPDFVVIGKFGREEIHEVKGKESPDWKLKWKMMQALYPEYHYRLVKRGDF